MGFSVAELLMYAETGIDAHLNQYIDRWNGTGKLFIIINIVRGGHLGLV